jgi:hypothetical protein
MLGLICLGKNNTEVLNLVVSINIEVDRLLVSTKSSPSFCCESPSMVCPLPGRIGKGSPFFKDLIGFSSRKNVREWGIEIEGNRRTQR